MADRLHLRVDRVATPIGILILVADDDGRLRAVDWIDHEPRMLDLLRRQYRGMELAMAPARNPAGLSDAFAAYFAGDLGAIDGLPVANGGTAFQRAVWQELRRIPCGETTTYRELAGRIGRPMAVRAVGHANGANPISVAVPCHRVVGSDGSLTGYGGGIERKRWLLAHERALPSRGMIAGD